jgi:hypothetical protein
MSGSGHKSQNNLATKFLKSPTVYEYLNDLIDYVVNHFVEFNEKTIIARPCMAISDRGKVLGLRGLHIAVFVYDGHIGTVANE